MTSTHSLAWENTTHVPVTHVSHEWVKGLIVTLISIGIILSNIVNLAVLSKMKQLPSTMRMFLLNLSASDLLVGAVACASASYPAFTEVWPFGRVWCQISGINHGTSLSVSIWSIAMVGIDRYIAACHPYKYQQSLLTRHSRWVIVLLWFLAFVTFLAPVFTKPDMTYYQYDDVTNMCGLRWEYPAFCAITGLYIPVLSGIVLVFTTLRINRALKRKVGNHSGSERSGSTGTNVNDNFRHEPTPRDSNRATMNRKAVTIMVLTATSFFSCWGPYVIVVVTRSLSSCPLSLPAWVEFSFMWLANANSIINVFIYSGTNKAFRQTAIQILRNLKMKITHGQLQSFGNNSTTTPVYSVT